MEKRRSRRSDDRRPEPRAATSPSEAPSQEGIAPQPSGVRVQWGPMTDWLEVAGMTVGEVYRLLQRPYNLAPRVQPLVNHREVGADQRLAAGDELEFVRLAGEKG